MTKSQSRTEHSDLFVYVARHAEYDSGSPDGQLGFTNEADAKRWVFTTGSVMNDDQGWFQKNAYIQRYEDNVGNWAEVERVRISDPEGLLAYE